MQDMFFVRFHEVTLLIYLLSISCYFYDFFKKNHKIRTLGFYTLGIVWVLQTISLSLYINMAKAVPLGSVFDVFYFLNWLILSFSIVISVVKHLEFSIFLFNAIGFIVMAIHTFRPNETFIQKAEFNVNHELLIIHVSLAIVSYAFFSLAFVNAALYVLQYRNLKQKHFDQKYFRIGSVNTLEKMTFYSTIIGFTLLVIGVILGAQWGFQTIGYNILLDPKVISSIIVMVCYVIYILIRTKKWVSPINQVLFNMLIYMFSMFNLIFVSHFPNFFG
ncbi:MULTISPECIES: cytochrome C assembly family protein [Staphylococcus]|uniref:cytochrome C assembly family protein n=1 Tax=Staphylococcus TaxID=1279 RepID=UPI0021D1F456|nr:cytochrome c biogenesis protein [Staphylococcus sp. IVB6181]UXV36133.1 cytochrome c biogenesis protein [Staphylococcus sp. IVB6181]